MSAPSSGSSLVADDPICNICGEPKSAHVATDAGPFTHPREARGEGTYKLVREGGMRGGFWPGEEYYENPAYDFVPKETTDAK